MKVQTFKDGERLVIIVEGIDAPTEKELLSGLLSKVTSDNMETLPPAEAKSVPVEDQEPYIYVETSFFKGNLEDAYDKVDNMAKELELLKALGGNSESYLKHKFSKMDPKGYADKLTDSQKKKFFDTYGPYMPEALVDKKNVAEAISYYHDN